DGLADDADASVRASTESTWYTDADSDGYGLSSATTVACDRPSGAVATGGDCDDGNASVNPGRTEGCNAAHTDDDGDALAYDADPSAATTGMSTWYTDGDGDGYGDPSTAARACDAPSGAVAITGDCDDSDDAYNPGATERCTDPHDYNCDGSVGYADADG